MDLKAQLLSLLCEKSFFQGEFTLTSGKKSNYYIDMKATLTHPQGAALIGDLLLDRIAALPYRVAAIGGMALGAVPVVMTVVARSEMKGLPIPGFWVRPERKDHGHGKRIEGYLSPDAHVILVDDVVTTAGSTVKCLDAIREEFPLVSVTDTFAVVDRNEGGRENLAARGIKLNALITVDELFSHAKEMGKQ